MIELDPSLINDFVAEAGEHLEEMEATLLRLAGDPANRELLNAIFRPVHTIKGAARGVGAFQLGDACERAEAAGPGALDLVKDALDAALADVAAYAHERALQSLRTPRS